jgi:hypothetical protein
MFQTLFEAGRALNERQTRFYLPRMLWPDSNANIGLACTVNGAVLLKESFSLRDMQPWHGHYEMPGTQIRYTYGNQDGTLNLVVCANKKTGKVAIARITKEQDIYKLLDIYFETEREFRDYPRCDITIETPDKQFCVVQ